MNKPSPLINIAAITVIVASLAAVGAIMGIIPSTHSQRFDGEGMNKERRSPLGGASALNSVGGQDATDLELRAQRSTLGPCAQCGVIEAVRSVEVPGQGSALGAAAEAIAGAQFGSEDGRRAGGAGISSGIYEGHTIEETLRRRTSHRVTVRMDDGSARTIYQSSPPAFRVGERVKFINGALLAANG